MGPVLRSTCTSVPTHLTQIPLNPPKKDSFFVPQNKEAGLLKQVSWETDVMAEILPSLSYAVRDKLQTYLK